MPPAVTKCLYSSLFSILFYIFFLVQILSVNWVVEALLFYQFEHFNFLLATWALGASQHLDAISAASQLSVEESHFGTM